VINPKQRPLPVKKQQSQETDFHAPAGFKPIIQARVQPQTQDLDREATGIGSRKNINFHISVYKNYTHNLIAYNLANYRKVRQVKYKYNVFSCTNPFSAVRFVILDSRQKLDVHRSVHRNIKLIERTNKMQPCSRIYYSNVFNWSTCFGRHTAQHQELKNCNCSLWFYIRLRLPPATMAEPSQRAATINVCKTRGCNYGF
jgi:hypothetical protein